MALQRYRIPHFLGINQSQCENDIAPGESPMARNIISSPKYNTPLTAKPSSRLVSNATITTDGIRPLRPAPIYCEQITEVPRLITSNTKNASITI